MASAAKLLRGQVMMPAPLPPDEPARPKARKRHPVLDTLPDGSLDRIARSAAPVAAPASKPGAKQEQVARDLGVSADSVSRWKQQYG